MRRCTSIRPPVRRCRRARLERGCGHFTPEVAPGATGVYTWAPAKAGTYLYQSGTMPSIQVPMGLYGAVTIRASLTQAYPSIAASAFNAERALLFSEIDSVQNAAVDAAASVTAYPSTIKYKPTYFLINGLAYDKSVVGLFDILRRRSASRSHPMECAR